MSSNLAREMTIFLDLDETLVHSVPGRGGNPGRRRVVRLEDGDSYWVMERPLARQMIEDCRALAPTCVLSSSSQDYAMAVCEALGFGFAKGDVMGWQRFLVETQPKNYDVIQTGYCPSSVLVDNALPGSWSALSKIRFLGIGPSHYLQVRTFRGKDSPHFPDEWAFHLSKLKGLL